MKKHANYLSSNDAARFSVSRTQIQQRLQRRSSFFVLAVVFVVFQFLTGCKKDMQDSALERSNLNMAKADKAKPNKTIHPNFNIAIGEKWLTVSQIATPAWISPFNGLAYTDLMNFAREMFSCVVDDYIVFHKNGTTDRYFAENKCDPSQPDVEPVQEGSPSRWEYNKKTHILTFINIPINGRLGNLEAEVLELTRDRLVIQYIQVLPFTNTTHTIVQTYIRIP
jgi:hypothetical protein